MQQQIEFEAIPFQHTVRIPDYIPATRLKNLLDENAISGGE